MKTLNIKLIPAILSVLVLFGNSGCSNASANGGGADSSGSTAPIRVTRGVLPQSSTIQQADGLCRSEFGSAYNTASREEIDGLTSINGLQVFMYAFNRSLGTYSEGCPDTYCVVVCMRK